MNKGITLIELLVALGILAVVLLVAVPSFSSYIQDLRLKHLTSDLYSKLLLMRSDAMNRNIPIYFDFSDGNNWCYGISDVGECDCKVANSCLYGGVEFVVKSEANETVGFTVQNIADKKFDFSGPQGASSDSGEIKLENDNNSISISISTLGRVNMCSDTMAGYQGC